MSSLTTDRVGHEDYRALRERLFTWGDAAYATETPSPLQLRALQIVAFASVGRLSVNGYGPSANPNTNVAWLEAHDGLHEGAGAVPLGAPIALEGVAPVASDSPEFAVDADAPEPREVTVTRAVDTTRLEAVPARTNTEAVTSPRTTSFSARGIDEWRRDIRSAGRAFEANLTTAPLFATKTVAVAFYGAGLIGVYGGPVPPTPAPLPTARTIRRSMLDRRIAVLRAAGFATGWATYLDMTPEQQEAVRVVAKATAGVTRVVDGDAERPAAPPTPPAPTPAPASPSEPAETPVEPESTDRPRVGRS